MDSPPPDITVQRPVAQLALCAPSGALPFPLCTANTANQVSFLEYSILSIQIFTLGYILVKSAVLTVLGAVTRWINKQVVQPVCYTTEN